MKLKNISVGDSVQIKKSMCHIEFKAKQVCEVIDTDPTDKHGFDVLIQGKNCLDWVNHKDLKKYIDIEPEPKLKQLDQSVFDGLDAKWRFAAVDKIGAANGFNKRVEPIDDMFDMFDGDDDPVEIFYIGTGYDTTDWQNSLIERESVELTGSDLTEAMFKRGDNYVMCITGALRKLVIIDTLEDGKFYSFGTMYENPIPINNQGEPLTQSEVGL